MAYVDHAFSITEDDSAGSYAVHNSPPIKEISLALALLVFGTVGIIVGFIMMYNKIGGDRGHGIFLRYLEACYLSPGFITPGLHTMLTRVTKGSPFQTFRQFEEFHGHYSTVDNDHGLQNFHVFYLIFCLGSFT